MPDAASPAATLDIDRVYVIHVRKGAEDRAAFIERQLARLGIESVDGELRAELDAVLLAAALDDCVHRFPCVRG